MDPTMGDTQAYTGQPGMSAYLTTADMQPDQQPTIEQAVAETLPVEPEAPKYPIGRIDYNKPFEVVDRFNEDVIHADARVVAVLSGNAYPVVIASTDADGEVVNQFDLDGTEMNGNLKIENVEPEVYPRTVYLVMEKGRRGAISVDHDVYDSEADALDEADGATLAIFPVTIEANSFAPRYAQRPEPVVEQDDDSEVEEDDHVEEQLPEGAVRVNGSLTKAGDKVRAWRRNLGYERTCTVIKTRPDPYKALYIQADSDGSAPYWANNSSIRQIYPG
jgi:hypothetical protein